MIERIRPISATGDTIEGDMREMYEPASPSNIFPEESALALAMSRWELSDHFFGEVIVVNRTFVWRHSACSEMVLKGDR
jgi:hypothetical protein